MQEPVSSRRFSCTAKYPKVKALPPVYQEAVKCRNPSISLSAAKATERTKYQQPLALVLKYTVQSGSERVPISPLCMSVFLAFGISKRLLFHSDATHGHVFGRNVSSTGVAEYLRSFSFTTGSSAPLNTITFLGFRSP
jgi:hypothetical protein